MKLRMINMFIILVVVMVSQAYAYVKTQQIIRFKYVRPIAPQFFKNLNDLPGRDEPDPNEKPLDSSH